jgi:subtilase family serine protease
MGGDFSRTTPGQTLPITVNFQNLGPAAAGAFRIDLRLSLDAIFGNADDIVLGSIIVTGIDALATGSAVFTIDFDATAVPPVGSYFVGGRIDAGRTVTEVNEANNDGFSAMATIRIVA